MRQQFSKDSLFLRKKLRVHGFAGGGSDADGGVQRKSDRRQANLRAARLVAKLERDMLSAERSARHRRNRNAERDGVLVDVQRLLREGERVQCAFGIRNISQLKSSGSIGAKVGGDQIVFRFFARVDVKARADFQDHRKLKLAATAHRVKRSIDCGGYNILRRRNLLRRRGQCRNPAEKQDTSENGRYEFHIWTCVPNCCETTRFIT